MTVGDLIEIDEPHVIDRRAIIGEPTGREIESRTLRIGPHAVLRSNTVIYEGSTIGSHFETGHNVVIREQNVVGDHVSVWSNSIVDYGCRIGRNVRIHSNVYLAQFTVLEDDVFLAPAVTVANDPHPICYEHLQGPTIKAGARVGINVTLLPGVVVGEDALVGAGAVVTKNVSARDIVVGNPARVIGTVDKFDCPHRLIREGY